MKAKIFQGQRRARRHDGEGLCKAIPAVLGSSGSHQDVYYTRRIAGGCVPAYRSLHGKWTGAREDEPVWAFRRRAYNEEESREGSSHVAVVDSSWPRLHPSLTEILALVCIQTWVCHETWNAKRIRIRCWHPDCK